MPYVVTATWKPKPGEEATVRALLEQNRASSRQEPGCLLFLIHEDREEPGTLFMYEQFVSKEAFDAHISSEHFRTLVLEGVVPRLDVRERHMYELIP